jgi:hypothetical protein
MEKRVRQQRLVIFISITHKTKRRRSMRYKALIALLAIAFACQSGNVFAAGEEGEGMGVLRKTESGEYWVYVPGYWIQAQKNNPGHGVIPGEPGEAVGRPPWAVPERWKRRKKKRPHEGWGKPKFQRIGPPWKIYKEHPGHPKKKRRK